MCYVFGVLVADHANISNFGCQCLCRRAEATYICDKDTKAYGVIFGNLDRSQIGIHAGAFFIFKLICTYLIRIYLFYPIPFHCFAMLCVISGGEGERVGELRRMDD